MHYTFSTKQCSTLQYINCDVLTTKIVDYNKTGHRFLFFSGVMFFHLAVIII